MSVSIGASFARGNDLSSTCFAQDAGSGRFHAGFRMSNIEDSRGTRAIAFFTVSVDGGRHEQ
jgi:hypothetical protein